MNFRKKVSWIKIRWEESKFRRQILKDLSENEDFSRNRWSLADKIIIWGSKHIALAILVLIAIIFSLTFLLMECELLTEQDILSTVFQSQVTLLGIIFPVIIGFVAIMLQGKPYNEPIWEVYQDSCGFKLAISSFLSFAIIFVVYQFFESSLPNKWFVIASNSFLIWFTVNLMLSGFFFWKTIQFLSAHKRIAMITKYIINEMPSYIARIGLRISNLQKQLDTRELSQADRLNIPQHTLRIDKLLMPILSETRETIDLDPKLFQLAKENLISFYREIASSMACKNQEGEPDNYLLVPAKEYPLAPTFIHSFILKTTRISDLVIKKIPNDDIYYKIWCVFYIELFNILKIDAPRDIAVWYFNGHYVIWKKLMEYMANSSLNLNQRNHLIDYYMGRWESWRVIAKNIMRIGTTSFYCAEQHLVATSDMLYSAMKHENSEAAEKTVHLLNEWLILFSTNISMLPYGYCRGNNLLNLSCEVITKDTDAPRLVHDKLEKEKISAIALRNYWIDIRWLVAAYLMRTPNCPTRKNYINDILACTTPDQDTFVYEQCIVPIRSISDILRIYIRQIQLEYVENLGNFYKRLAGGGMDLCHKEEFLEYLLPFYQVICIGVAKHELDTNMVLKWKEFLKSDAIMSQKETSLDLKKLTSIDDTVIKKVCFQFDISDDEAKKRQNIFIKSINSICDIS